MIQRRFRLRRAASPNWHRRIETANTESEVIDIVRDLLASLDPKDLLALPRGCEPPRIGDSDDVAAYALAFVRQDLRGAAGGESLDNLAGLIVHASNRLSKIAARAHMAAATPFGRSTTSVSD